MYCYLGIVAQDDQVAGHIVPSYVLCQSRGTAATRSGWRVVRQDDTNKSLRNMNKVLVTELYGHEDMIDYLCAYRTRDHMHKDDHYEHADTKKYYPKGAQFWFECTIHGDPNGSAIFICRIPIMDRRKTDDGFQRLKESRAHISPLKTRLAREPTMIGDALICLKPHLEQRRR